MCFFLQESVYLLYIRFILFLLYLNYIFKNFSILLIYSVNYFILNFSFNFSQILIIYNSFVRFRPTKQSLLIELKCSYFFFKRKKRKKGFYFHYYYKWRTRISRAPYGCGNRIWPNRQPKKLEGPLNIEGIIVK